MQRLVSCNGSLAFVEQGVFRSLVKTSQPVTRFSLQLAAQMC